MRIDLTVCGVDGVERDVAVVAPAAVPFADVAAALRPVLGPGGTADGWCTGTRPLADTDRLGGPGLRCGDRLSPAPQASSEPATRRVDVVAGIDAGASLDGARRTVVIGRDPRCDLPLRDPDVSRRHAELTFTATGVVVRDLGSTHGTAIGTTPVTGPTVWNPPHWLRLGSTHLAHPGVRDGPASARPTREGTLVVRARRAAPVPAPQQIDAPAVPVPVRSAGATWSAAIVPALAGAGLAAWTGSVTFLFLALLSPLALVTTVAVDRARDRRRTRRSGAQLTAAAVRADAAIAAAVQAETAARRAAFPDARTVLATARGPSERLWERGADDRLRVRLGVADLPAQARVCRDGQSEPAGVLSAVPVVLDLADGPVGLVGPRGTIRAIARWLIAQLAVFASPAEVGIELHAANDLPWSWLRWLPHLHLARAPTGPSPLSLVRVYDSPVDPPDVTVPAICLAENRSELPPGCSQVVVVANEAGTRVRLGGQDVLTDAVDVRWAERLARALAPLVPVAASAQVLPGECRLGEIVGPAEPAAIARRWLRTDGGAEAVLGLGSDGPVVLDLDRHGPHALVAGTTGAGKSQLLRTLVAALACAYPPDEIGFVLVDYKGGSAFAECAALPHVVGLVTDLDEHLTARALASLRCELRRREGLFAAAGVSDLAGYRACAAAPQLGRLIIVVDEYAALSAELPDFVTGLTGIAQRGRSLGLHLVLATQRPAGVVTADVRANCSVRIALRVTDVGDSQDVIDGPQAAAIAHELPGRAYLWADGATRPVQVARTDLPAVSGAKPVEVHLLGPWRSLAPGGPEGGTSELSALVAAIGQAAAGRQPPPTPWLPPLPDRLSLDVLPVVPTRGVVAIGIVDVPSRQAHRPLVLDLRAGSSVLVAGAPRSGRTTALVTIALAAAARHGPEELQIHAIDLHGDLSAILDGLPHCGTVVTPADAAELADALLRELEPDDDDICSLLLVDGWDAFARNSEECDGGAGAERLLSHLRSARRGRTIAISGDRTALAPRVAGTVSTRLLLRLPDRTDAALAGVPLAAVPRTMPPGRVLIAPDGTVAQLAHSGPEPTLAAAVASVRAATATCEHAPTALRLRPLPPTLDVSELPPPGELLPFAVTAPRCRPIGLPLTAATRLLVVGPPRSGRSTTLDTLLDQAVRGGHRVTVVASARSPVRVTAARLGVDVLDPYAGPTVTERNHGLLLVDDSTDFADSALDDRLAQQARMGSAAMVVTARTEDAARAYRGLVFEIRRSRCALLLQPGPLDGEVVGIRLRPGLHGGPPGRGVLLGDPAWNADCAPGPVRVQVATVGQPICG